MTTFKDSKFAGGVEQDQIPMCNCQNAFGPHKGYLFTLAECNVMYQEHFGQEPAENMPFVDMMKEVFKTVGMHHIITDVNKLRATEFNYVKEGAVVPGGFCIENK